MKIQAVFDVDVETLKQVADTESVNDAIEQEFGWMTESGIYLTDFEILKDNHK